MKMKKRGVLLAMMALVAVSACSSKADEKDSERFKDNVLCANYRVDRHGYEVKDGLPVVDGITAIHVSENCDLEITALKDEDPAGVPDPWATGPTLSDGPREITRGLRVNWISIAQDKQILRQFVVLPAYVFQCLIDEKKDPAFQCKGAVTSTHKLSTYTEQAYDISGEATWEFVNVNLSFVGSNKDTYAQQTQLTKETVMHKANPTSWSLLLVEHSVWEKSGVARVCLPAPSTVPCEVVKARLLHNEDYLLGRDIEHWGTAVDRFREQTNQPLFKYQVEPGVPGAALHRDFDGGPISTSFGVVVSKVIASWENSDTTLQSKELKGSLKIGLSGEASGGHGKERGMASSAMISYEPKDIPPGRRCMEILAVGGKPKDPPLTGIVMKEGCEP